ncbi:tyrosine-protein phosphatase non-receptor type 18 isoform X2 [Poecilia reticulata]|uniref:tyrosine-protein phosphatase non-receptor type 18 isoform X2 n=1 Tax=Poecilia reticulata TaxID=8081 RepID=UPI0007EA7CD5|nr:PREDICTED: tyrosine-protein phosphatase non-receptor type 18-like isoform X2 [Poecilia reticulata]
MDLLLSALKAVDPAAVEQEYQVVRSQSLQLKKRHGLTTEVGSLKDNAKKNRYKDILPYDQTRVVLSLQTSGSDSDYINASFVQGASGDCRYIASQAPLSSTLTDFWRMIWQHKIKVIVMACREVEMGKRKCECYWAAPHQSAAFGPFTVTTVESRPNQDVVVRTLVVCYQQVGAHLAGPRQDTFLAPLPLPQDVHSLVQFQYLSWPDHDVPYETAGILDLLDRARSSQGAESSPVLVHCSAGCGRTGVVCALDYIHDLLVTKASSVMSSSLLQKITEDFSVLDLVLELRRQRPSAVQTKVGLHVQQKTVLVSSRTRTSGSVMRTRLPVSQTAQGRLCPIQVSVVSSCLSWDSGVWELDRAMTAPPPGGAERLSDCGCASRTSTASSSAPPPACWSASCLGTVSTATCRRKRKWCADFLYEN